MKANRFRIAFSFAGEKRVFVEKVAAILAKRFGEAAILYDKYHEAEFARRNLGIYLPELYHKQTDLVVVVVCPDYDVKQWTGLEWTAIHDLLSQRKDAEVMLCRFDHAKVAGLFSTAGFIELDNKTPKQFAALILERLALNEGKPKNYYAASAAPTDRTAKTSIPNNLPRLPYFFGREAELKKIADALAPDARGWGALIDGPGGIGKTSLAIRAAELVPSGRFQRIIFLSAKERELTTDGQRALGHFVLPGYLEMLNAIARELEQPNLAKLAESERSDAILRALRESDVLLVLDNLETLPEGDRDQLFTFLNRLPQRCSAIVTSRRRADASAIAIRLDKLDWPAALDLINELAQDNIRLSQTSEAERQALYAETGGNPLLIRWIAGQLGLGRCKTIAAALDFLRSASPGNDPLEFIFGDLLDNFTPNETNVLAALAHFTTPMEVNFVAELAHVNSAAAQGALSDLSSRALVLPDLEERRFALMPMVADFLRRKCPEIVSEIGNRLEKHAYALIVQNGFDRYGRFAVLDAAWPTVAPALPLFVAGPNAQLQTICEALCTFFEITNRSDEWLSLEQQAESRAIGERDYLNAGMRAYQAGRVHVLRKQANGALACAERAAVHWQNPPAAAHERAMAIRLRGLGHRLNENYPAAIAAFREAIDLYHSSTHGSEDLGFVLVDLAKVEHLTGDFAGAERDYRESLRAFRSFGSAGGMAISTSNLAALALAREDWKHADALAREALELADRLGNQALTARNLQRLAKALVRQGKAAEALPHAQRAVDIFTGLGSPDVTFARAILAECEQALSSSKG